MNSFLFQAGLLVSLLVLGYLFGSIAEKRHYRRIIAREAKSADLPVIASRYPPEDRQYAQQLVSGNVVIASDYFKNFLAGLFNIFGGRVTPYESMLDRARRESVLRMKEAAARSGASYVFNIKFDTTRVSAGRASAMEVLAYGTAMIPIDKAPLTMPLVKDSETANAL
ncbi:MAG: YbjQ family protein [Granulosicoccus sp.]